MPSNPCIEPYTLHLGCQFRDDGAVSIKHLVKHQNAYTDLRPREGLKFSKEIERKEERYALYNVRNQTVGKRRVEAVRLS